MNNKKDQMHPEDFRNLIIFGLASVVLWFLYTTYILEPQKQALQKAKDARAEMIEKNPEALKPVKVVTREQALAQVERITFENDKVKGSIPLKGGYFDDLSLKEYFVTLKKEKNVTLFTPNQTESARFVDYGWLARDKGVRTPNANTQWSVAGNQKLTKDNPVTLSWNNGQGLLFERVISVDDQFVFSIVQRVTNQSGQEVDLHPYALVSQTSIPKDYQSIWISHEGPMGFLGDTLEQMDYAAMVKDPNKKIEAETGWIGFSDKYWLTALMPEQNRIAKYRFKYAPDPVSKKQDTYQTDYTGSPYSIQNGETVEHRYNLYAGAKKVLTLEAYQGTLGVDNLDLAVDFGWFWFFTYPFFLALHYLALLVGNVGVAIVLLTIMIRMAVFPLTSISYRSFAKMKVVTPIIKELREKYADDKEKLQQEIMRLYQQEGVNPMSGCLPILVQIPIFFAFYKILFTTIEIRHAPFFGWIEDLSARDPTSVFNLFGVLPYEVPSILVIGAWPCMMLVAMLMQKKLNPPPQDKLQKDMMNFFPFIITFVMSKFASGLVIYWAFSATVSVLQQGYIMRSMGVPIYFFNKDHYKEEMERAKEESEKGAQSLLIDGSEDAESETDDAAAVEEETPKDIKPPKPKKKKKKK